MGYIWSIYGVHTEYIWGMRTMWGDMGDGGGGAWINRVLYGGCGAV